jgi:hypothetical protein
MQAASYTSFTSPRGERSEAIADRFRVRGAGWHARLSESGPGHPCEGL